MLTACLTRLRDWFSRTRARLKDHTPVRDRVMIAFDEQAVYRLYEGAEQWRMLAHSTSDDSVVIWPAAHAGETLPQSVREWDSHA